MNDRSSFSRVFKTLAWFYPLLYLGLVGMSNRLIFTGLDELAQVFSFKVSTAQTIFYSEILFFVFSLVVFSLKYRWFKANIGFLIVFWLLSYIPLTSSTQGAVSACISKAFSSEESARKMMNGK